MTETDHGKPYTDADVEAVSTAIREADAANVHHYDAGARAVLDALTAAGWRKLDTAGICGDTAPTLAFISNPVQPHCTLIAGHAGWHQDDNEARWQHHGDGRETRGAPVTPSAGFRHVHVGELYVDATPRQPDAEHRSLTRANLELTVEVAQLRHEVTRLQQQPDRLVTEAVITAGRAWRASLAGLMDDTTPEEDALCDALDTYDAAEETSTTDAETPGISEARVLAAMDSLGWEDDRTNTAHPRALYDTAEDAIRAADAVAPAPSARAQEPDLVARYGEALDLIAAAVCGGTDDVDNLRDGVRSMVRRVRPEAVALWAPVEARRRARAQEPPADGCGACWACRAAHLDDPAARVVRAALDWRAGLAALDEGVPGWLTELVEAVDALLAGPACVDLSVPATLGEQAEG